MKKRIDLLELVTLRESSLTLREIVERLGVGKTSIYAALRRARAE